MTATLDTTEHNETCVIGDAVFSSWAGATLSGRGALFGQHHDLAEMRNMPGAEGLPKSNVVSFCRKVTVDTEPGRFIGAFRTTTDQKDRPSLHGYGVLVVGQDMNSFHIALDALQAFDQVKEEDYSRVASATGFFDAQHSPNTYRPSVSLLRSRKKATYALDTSHDRFETWRTLWVLSFTRTDVQDIFASSGFAAAGVDLLPVRPRMPAPRPSMPSSQPAMAHAHASRQGGHASSDEDPNASLIDSLLMPVDTRDPDLLAERLSIAHQAIHELVTSNQEHDQRLRTLENAYRRSSGYSNAAVHTQANAGVSQMSRGFGERDLMTEVEPRSWWPEIAVGATLLILLLCLITFFVYLR